MEKNPYPGTHKFLQSHDGSMENGRTGEVISDREGTFVYVPKRMKMRNGFMMFFLESLEKLAKDEELTGESYRVLLYLLSQLDFENYILLEQKRIAEELNMRFQHVSRAIGVLTKKGILIRGPRSGKSWGYRLNSSYGWRGNAKSMYDAEQEEMRELMAVKKPPVSLVVDNTKNP